jgi:hypothetical protein
MPACFAFAFCAASVLSQQIGPDIDQAIKEIDAVGGAYHRAVVAVSFRRVEKYNGDDIVKLVPLRYHLRSLDLYATPLTDHGLRDIHKLPDLTELNLRRTLVTDAACQQLARLTKLRKLLLAGTAVTGARFDHFKNLTELTELDLSKTKINRDGMAQIKELSSLETLFLADTGVSNTGVAELRYLPHLAELHLTGTKLDGPGGMDAQWAESLAELRHLRLSHTRVDDRCIPVLAKLPSLATLYIEGTGITTAGIAKLVELRRNGFFQGLDFLGVSPLQVDDETRAALVQAFDDLQVHFIEDP